MYCTVCGHENLDDARFCTECGSPQRDSDITQVDHGNRPTDHYLQPPAATTPERNIPNYLAQAILVTIFCCFPAGIVAIVLAAQVNGKVARGDIQGALQSSHNAKTWCWISFGLAIAFGIIFLILGLVAG